MFKKNKSEIFDHSKSKDKSSKSNEILIKENSSIEKKKKKSKSKSKSKLYKSYSDTKFIENKAHRKDIEIQGKDGKNDQVKSKIY